MTTTEQSTFNQIRSLLAQAERDVVAMRQEPSKAEHVIRSVEQAEAMLTQLQSQRVDVRAEEGRADSLRGRLLREAQLVQQLVVKSGRTQALADSTLFDEIQTLEAQRRARSRRNLLLGGGAVVIVALLLFVVLPWLFPTPPSADILAVADLASQGNLEGALTRAQAEQAQAPNDAQIGIWIAGLQQQLSRPEAEQAWKDAQARYQNQADFLAERANVELALGNVAAAEQTANELRAQPDGAAIGTYQLAAVRELQRQNQEAIKLFEEAGKLADQEGRPELVVLSRQRMAALMQRP